MRRQFQKGTKHKKHRKGYKRNELFTQGFQQAQIQGLLASEKNVNRRLI